MLFTSYKFFIFFPLATLIYFIVPRRIRPLTLLLESYCFYYFFGIKHLIPLWGITVLSYAGGLFIERSGKNKKACTGFFVIIAVMILVYFKYTGFILSNVNSLISLGGSEDISLPFSIIQPVGISYLTLQIISYLVDIYRGNIKAEHSIINYALYIAFFPKILSGPIEKGQPFLTQVRESANKSLWDAERIRDGFTRMAWGFFLKLVIADRLSVFVNNIYAGYAGYGRIILIIGAVCYVFQLMGDFTGSMDIALGLAKVLGFELSENFKGPMFSKSIKESWNRWHMTLGVWLRDYIYIPLGGSRLGNTRRIANILIVFIISGLWHDAAWHYVAWGLVNALYEIAEDSFGPKKPEGRLINIYGPLRTFALWSISLIFFRSKSTKDAISFIIRAITVNDYEIVRNNGLLELGVSGKYLGVAAVAVFAMFVVEYIRYKTDKADIAPLFGKLHILPRYALLLLLIMSVIVFGAYGASYDAANFIYFGF